MNTIKFLSRTRILSTVALAALAITTPMARAQTLAQALNTTNLTWTTSGTFGAYGWYGQTTTSHDGVSAAASGTIVSVQTSTLQTTVSGPGTLTFWWRNPSYNNRLSFLVGGTTLTYIILYSSWQQQTQYIGSGNQTLSWVYSVVTSPADTYHGYVDQVSFTPGATAPIITTPPTSQSQVPGLNATLTVGAGGTPPLSYQWSFAGTNIPGATASAYTVTNVQAGNLGDYSVVVSNSVDSVTSSNATLTIAEITAWGGPSYGATSVPSGATNVLDMAAGMYCNLLLNADHTVSGWGANTLGQTTIPAGLTNVIAISTYAHSLALRADGTVAAWGGQGFGVTNVPTGLSNVVAIAVGNSPHSVALKSDGTVAVWGGYNGQTNVPADLTNVVAIDARDTGDLALKSDGTVTSWGNYPQSVPSDLTNVVAIAAGSSHCLALLANATVFAWGNNSYGQINVPGGLTNVVAIAAGDVYSLALQANGMVVAWGGNSSGQTNVPAGLTNVVAIAGGSTHCLAQVGSGPSATSAPITASALTETGFSLTVASRCGHVYALEYKDNLGDPGWLRLPLVAGTGSDLVLLDPTVTNTQRYYRVRRW